MNEPSKILIAYDGSEYSDAALLDLGRAGLPEKIEAVVVTIADVILPPPDEEVPESELLIHIPVGIRHALAHAEQAVKQARALAEQAAKRLQEAFPGWKISAEACGDSPAWALIKMSDQLKSDLIVLGSHGHSIVGGRLVLGSVSQRVLYESRCSVRVARSWDERRDGPVRIVIGYNGSPDSEQAVDAVVSHNWLNGSEVRIITAGETGGRASFEIAADKLRAAGLKVSDFAAEGHPAHVLIEEAQKWGADSIFVGTRDIHGFKHFLYGSVSSAVAARAGCSVEVVRKQS